MGLAEHQAIVAAGFTQTPRFFLPMTDLVPKSPSPFDTRTWTIVGTPALETSDPPPGYRAGVGYVVLDSGEGYTASEFNPYPLRLSVGGWFRPDSIPGASVNLWRLGVLNGPVAREFKLGANGKFQIVANTGAVVAESTTVVTAGEWYHVILVNDGDGGTTGRRIVVNGVVEVSISGGSGSGAPNNYAFCGDGFVGAVSQCWWSHQAVDGKTAQDYADIYNAAVRLVANVRQAIVL